MSEEIVVFAPASIGNVGVGFDILGQALEAIGDIVRVKKIEGPRVIIRSISGVVAGLPLEASQNTAGIVLLEMIKKYSLNFGFEIAIEKGIPLGSGMGGSAASAVGALVGANYFLPCPLSKEELFTLALAGEALASGGSGHGDNIAPCLFGGITLVKSLDPVDIICLPTPEEIYVGLVHPHMKIETKLARAVLPATVPLQEYVHQSAELAGVIAGLFLNDLELIGRALNDVIIGPRRSHLIPGFDEVKTSALNAGALCLAISGSGPSIFAWSKGETKAKEVEAEMRAAFARHSLKCDSWISPMACAGAVIMRG